MGSEAVVEVPIGSFDRYGYELSLCFLRVVLHGNCGFLSIVMDEVGIICCLES